MPPRRHSQRRFHVFFCAGSRKASNRSVFFLPRIVFNSHHHRELIHCWLSPDRIISHSMIITTMYSHVHVGLWSLGHSQALQGSIRFRHSRVWIPNSCICGDSSWERERRKLLNGEREREMTRCLVQSLPFSSYAYQLQIWWMVSHYAGCQSTCHPVWRAPVTSRRRISYAVVIQALRMVYGHTTARQRIMALSAHIISTRRRTCMNLNWP